MTAAELRTLLISRLHNLPSVQEITVSEELLLTVAIADGVPITMGLQNLFDGIKQDPSASERLINTAIAHVNDAVAMQFSANSITRDEFVAALIPTIKNARYLRDVRDAVNEAGANQTPPPLYRPLAGDVIAHVALDRPNTFQMVHSGAGSTYNLSDDQVYEIAVQNLTNKVSNLKLIVAGPIKIIDFHSDYNASLLLVDSVWSSVAPGSENDVVAAVPARDALIFGSALDPAALLELRNVAAAPSQAYPITDKLLRRTANGWVVFE
jgi:uncharacterized protein YtpQ (UPF0354 family)